LEAHREVKQTKIARILLLALALIALLSAAAWPQRRLLVLRVFGLMVEPPSLSEASQEPESVTWFDDYFTVEFIDPQTIAIGEPRYWQQNYSYLILGGERAILFDSGPGVRDIKPVVESLTQLPVTVASSHLHYDHVGNHERFERIALVDLPHLRERVQSGVFRPLPREHLGFLEGFEPPDLGVSEWWAPESQVDLGSRGLSVVHAPGHTPESIVLLDRDRHLLFTGDYIYEGLLLAFLPGSDLRDYLLTARRLVETVPHETRLLTAHRETPPGAPVLDYQDLVDLYESLGELRRGTLEGDGFYINSYRINRRLRLLAEMPWLERWE
jgi:glyoxylase-like metal-dependent hydrolase (beta-lactamase superfamily II)